MTIKIPPMPEVEKSEAEGNLVLHMYCGALEVWGQSLTRIAQEQADRADAAEARLAAVPALVEALVELLDDSKRRHRQRCAKHATEFFLTDVEAKAAVALAAWEGEK